MNISSQLSIGWQLLRREVIALSSSWKNDLLDSFIMSGVAVATFGFFMPAMGMPLHLRLPLVIGSLIVSIMFFGYTTGVVLSVDLSNSNLWGYHLALPTSIWVIVGVQVLAFMIRILLFVIPAGVASIFALYEPGAMHIAWGGLLMMVVLSSAFFSLLFFWAVMHFRSDSYFNDLWPRLLAPMYSFGCLFFTWKGFATHRPYLAKILLCNPITYCIEGLRTALCGGNEYLPLTLCVPVLAGLCVGGVIACHRVVIKRLNPVLPRGGVS